MQEFLNRPEVRIIPTVPPRNGDSHHSDRTQFRIGEDAFSIFLLGFCVEGGDGAGLSRVWIFTPYWYWPPKLPHISNANKNDISSDAEGYAFTFGDFFFWFLVLLVAVKLIIRAFYVNPSNMMPDRVPIAMSNAKLKTKMNWISEKKLNLKKP